MKRFREKKIENGFILDFYLNFSFLREFSVLGFLFFRFCLVLSRAVVFCDFKILKKIYMPAEEGQSNAYVPIIYYKNKERHTFVLLIYRSPT